MKYLAVALLVLGCQNNKPAASGGSGSAPQGSAPAGDCATAGDGIAKIWNKQIADAESADVKAEAQDKKQKLVQRLIRHCRDDHWNAEAIACARNIPACDPSAKLDAAQQQKLAADPAEQ